MAIIGCGNQGRTHLQAFSELFAIKAVTVFDVQEEILKKYIDDMTRETGIRTCTFWGLRQRAAGQYYGGITCATVGQQRRRLHARMASDVLLHRRFEQLVAKLNV